MREAYCRRCRMPIYRATDAATGREIELDWMPTSYGAHLDRVRRAHRTHGLCTSALEMVADSHPDGAQYLLDLDTGVCRRVAPESADGHWTYRQDHTGTCYLSLSNHFEDPERE